MILEAGREVAVKEPDLVLCSPNGYDMVMRGNHTVCSSGDAELAVCARFVLAVRDRPGIATVAHIGGGFCLTAKMLGPEFDHTIYELEPSFSRFAPKWARFVPGDWHETFHGTYDAIIYDTFGAPITEAERSRLEEAGWLIM